MPFRLPKFIEIPSADRNRLELWIIQSTMSALNAWCGKHLNLFSCKQLFLHWKYQCIKALPYRSKVFCSSKTGFDNLITPLFRTLERLYWWAGHLLGIECYFAKQVRFYNNDSILLRDSGRHSYVPFHESFVDLKKILQEKKFHSDEDAIAGTEAYF